MMNYDVKRTAEIVKALRQDAKKTQEQASEDMGISIKTLRAVEQGQRGASIDTLCLIATYYDVSLDYLITGMCEKTECQSNQDIFSGLTEAQKYQMKEIVQNMMKTLGWK